MAVDPNWKDNIDIRKMFVGGLSADTSDETFLEYFKAYGGIEKAEIVRDNNKASRGFGFVTFENCDDLDVCLSQRPHKIDNKEIEVKRAIPKSDPNPTAHLRTKKLFIGGLREDCTDTAISEVLESISGIKPKEVQLMTDRMTNKFKGFAFATFENEDIVDKLYIIRNANICSRKVDMKKAEERGKGGSGGGGGFRGGRGGGRGGRGGGNNFGGAGYAGGGYEGYQQTSGYGDYGSSWEYDNGYGGGYGGGYASGYGGGYGSGYGGSSGGSSGRGYNMGQYGQESSNYGPSRGGRGRSRRGGGPYY